MKYSIVLKEPITIEAKTPAQAMSKLADELSFDLNDTFKAVSFEEFEEELLGGNVETSDVDKKGGVDKMTLNEIYNGLNDILVELDANRDIGLSDAEESHYNEMFDTVAAARQAIQNMMWHDSSKELPPMGEVVLASRIEGGHSEEVYLDRRKYTKVNPETGECYEEVGTVWITEADLLYWDIACFEAWMTTPVYTKGNTV